MSRPGCVEAIVRGDLDDLLGVAGPRRPAAGGGRGPLIALRLGGEEADRQAAGPWRPAGKGLFGGLYWGRERVVAQVRAAQQLRAAWCFDARGPRCGLADASPARCSARRSSRRPFPGRSTSTKHPASRLPACRRRAGPEGVRRLWCGVCTTQSFLHADLNVTNLVLEPQEQGGLPRPRSSISMVAASAEHASAPASGRTTWRACSGRMRSGWLRVRRRSAGARSSIFLRSYARADRAMASMVVEIPAELPALTRPAATRLAAAARPRRRPAHHRSTLVAHRWTRS